MKPLKTLAAAAALLAIAGSAQAETIFGLAMCRNDTGWCRIETSFNNLPDCEDWVAKIKSGNPAAWNGNHAIYKLFCAQKDVPSWRPAH